MRSLDESTRVKLTIRLYTLGAKQDLKEFAQLKKGSYNYEVYYKLVTESIARNDNFRRFYFLDQVMF